jgi:hypothetical protein
MSFMLLSFRVEKSEEPLLSHCFSNQTSGANNVNKRKMQGRWLSEVAAVHSRYEAAKEAIDFWTGWMVGWLEQLSS